MIQLLLYLAIICSYKK